jgi:hypothetical protein
MFLLHCGTCNQPSYGIIQHTPHSTTNALMIHVCCCARWAYNEDKVTFDSGNQMTLTMDGSSGTRLYYPVAMEYGLVDVTAKVSGVSGVISAFYVSRGC